MSHNVCQVWRPLDQCHTAWLTTVATPEWVLILQRPDICNRKHNGMHMYAVPVNCVSVNDCPSRVWCWSDLQSLWLMTSKILSSTMPVSILWLSGIRRQVMNDTSGKQVAFNWYRWLSVYNPWATLKTFLAILCCGRFAAGLLLVLFSCSKGSLLV